MKIYKIVCFHKGNLYQILQETYFDKGEAKKSLESRKSFLKNNSQLQKDFDYKLFVLTECN